MIFTKINIRKIDLQEEIRLKIKDGRTDELLLVVPTNRKIRYLKREIISASPGGTAAGLNIETLGTFAQKLLSQTESSLGRILTDAASAVLLKQSIAANKLRYFSIYKNEVPAGTLDRIKNVISEYKRHGISHELLREESNQLEGAEKLKAIDIADIYKTYNVLCSNVNVKEIGDIYAELNALSFDQFSSSLRSLYPKVEMIVIDGFDEFTSPEIELIHSASEVKGLELFLQLDYYGLNENIFSHLDKCYAKLIAKKFLIIEDIKETESSFEQTVREKLFLPGNPKTAVTNILKIEAASREKEVECIAKEIKDLISSGKAEPDGICVVFNLIKNYSHIIRDIFPVYGLPFNLTDRKALALSAPVVTIINFLEIAENDYYYKNIFRALSSGYIKLNELNLSNLYTASVKLRIISGYSHWITSLQDEINRLETEESNVRSGLLNVYKKALEDITGLSRILNPFSSKMTVKEFRILLIQTIFDLKIHSGILNNSLDNIEENIKGLTEFINTIHELFELLEAEEGNKKLPLKYFLNNIRTAVSGTRFNLKERPGFGIQVTNLNEIRGLQFDYLFIGGLCDGDLPTRYKPEIFNSGSYIKNEKNHQVEERYHFYQSLCSWKKQLILTYPKFSDKKELIKSNLLTEFEELFEIESRLSEEYDKKIYSREEFLNIIGSGKYTPADYSNIKLSKDQLMKSIGISKLRKDAGVSEFNGHIISQLDQASRQALEEYCSREFSVSRLETYAGCPFRFFMEQVLNLNTIEEPSEDIEAKELGSLLHSILYRFYNEIFEKGIVLKNADPECFQTAVDLIFSIAEEEIALAGFSPLSFYEKEKILGVEGKKEDSILYRFLLLEGETPDNFTPSYFEISFGDIKPNKQEKGESLIHFKAGDVKVRGKIDRIDIDHESERFKVIDYKTGSSKPSEKDIQAGLSLQLPLYIIAARELIRFKLGKEYASAGGEIFSLKYSEKDLKRNLIVKESEDMEDNCIQMIEQYVNSIGSGKFNLSVLEDREKKICRYCDYRTVCRIDELT